MPKNDGKTTQQRFNERYTVDPLTGCWNWTAGLNGKGYAYLHIMVGGICRTRQAYKLAYVWKFGNVRKGLELHHTCENTKCVNPDHVTPLTARQHRRIGASPAALNSQKTMCPRGHAYSGKNKNGGRICRLCNRDANRLLARAKRQARKEAGDYLPPPEARTICSNGHEYTPENTAYTNTGRRRCKICVRNWAKQYKQRKSNAL